MKEFIDKLINSVEEIKNNRFKVGNCDNYECYDADDDCATCYIQRIMSIINKLAEEYKGGWIACERELPKENEFVIASIHPREWINGGNPIIITRYDSISASYWHNGTIYAWMPLPAPFKEGE